MSLREEIARRRMAQSANGKATASARPEKTETLLPNATAPSPPPPLFLRLAKVNRQCWVLPWASFHGVGFTPGNAGDEGASKQDSLHMVFMRHQVSVRGYNLDSVINAIEATTLRELCESYEKYDSTANPENATPVILAVEINVKTQ